MKLEEYTTEQLKKELKRRNEEKHKEKNNELRCRNCIHIIKNPKFDRTYLCNARTWGKKITYNYTIKPYFKACDKFEKK